MRGSLLYDHYKNKVEYTSEEKTEDNSDSSSQYTRLSFID